MAPQPAHPAGGERRVCVGVIQRGHHCVDLAIQGVRRGHAVPLKGSPRAKSTSWEGSWRISGSGSVGAPYPQAAWA